MHAFTNLYTTHHDGVPLVQRAVHQHHVDRRAQALDLFVYDFCVIVSVLCDVMGVRECVLTFMHIYTMYMGRGVKRVTQQQIYLLDLEDGALHRVHEHERLRHALLLRRYFFGGRGKMGGRE